MILGMIADLRERLAIAISLGAIPIIPIPMDRTGLTLVFVRLLREPLNVRHHFHALTHLSRT
jgi:hypothetical protein